MVILSGAYVRRLGGSLGLQVLALWIAVASSVNCMSLTLARMVVVRSTSVETSIPAGILHLDMWIFRRWSRCSRV